MLVTPVCFLISSRLLNWRAFARPEVWKPLLLVLFLFLIQQFTGMSSISYYAVSVLVRTGSSVNAVSGITRRHRRQYLCNFFRTAARLGWSGGGKTSFPSPHTLSLNSSNLALRHFPKGSLLQYLATVIFGLMRLGGQILGSFLLIRFRRKVLLFVSSVCVSVGFALMATSAFLNDGGNGDSGVGGYLPLVAVILIAVTYHIGLGPIPWSYTGKTKRDAIKKFN